MIGTIFRPGYGIFFLNEIWDSEFLKKEGITVDICRNPSGDGNPGL